MEKVHVDDDAKQVRTKHRPGDIVSLKDAGAFEQKQVRQKRIEHNNGSVHSDSSREFSVHTGYEHSAPLGMSATHDHYIKPVPPTYVTEYESAYVWPPEESYWAHSRRGVYNHTKDLHRTKMAWDEMDRTISALQDLGYDKLILKTVMDPVSSHALEANIEIAMKSFEKRLNDPRDELPPNVRKLMEEFVAAANSLKGDNA